MKPYHHRVQYYETDRMGITHHSNYVRWMEEARLDFLSGIGCGYDKMERDGIISPVVSVDCRYIKPTTFPDDVAIEVSVKKFTGVRLVLEYKMTSEADGSLVCTACSEHCFVNSEFKPVRLRRDFPQVYNALVENSCAQKR